MNRLTGYARAVDEVHGFRSFDERDLLGFVDGTENPEGRAAGDAVVIGDEDPDFAGGSYAVVQKYLHDMAAWDALPVEEQERVVGRTKLSDIELADDVKPDNSHVALNTIVDDDGEERQIMRFNMPFGRVGVGEFGTYYIAYASSPDVIEEMLTNMFIGKPPGNYDRILDFSTAITGSLFFVPSADFLDDPGPVGSATAAAAAAEAPSAPEDADGGRGGRVTGNRQPEVGPGRRPLQGRLEPTITSSTTAGENSPCAGHAGMLIESRGQLGRVAERTLVIGQHAAVGAGRRAGAQADVADRADRGRQAERPQFERHRGMQRRHELVGRDDDHETPRRHGDDLLAQLGPMTALDRPVVGRDLVGAVDRDIELVDGIERLHRQPELGRQLGRLGRGRHAAQTAQAPLGQRRQQEGHRPPGAQPHPHVGLDQLGGGPRRLAHLMFLGRGHLEHESSHARVATSARPPLL